MKQLTMGSLFDGSGGFPLASQIVGIKPVWASEIEPFPIQVTKSRFPDMKHLGSVTDINGADIEPVDIITFGSPCFPGYTMINTDKGYKRICGIEVGDKVLTHTGKYQKVIDTGYSFNKIIELTCGTRTLQCTANHPIYSINENTGGKEWIPACDMFGRLCAIHKKFAVGLEWNKAEYTDDLFYWFRVMEVKDTKCAVPVYNFTVETDNSYTANDIVVHNCQNMSTAGRREGLNGEQSSLFFEAIRIIREMREATNNEYPKYAVWENVAGCLTSNKGEDFREVLQQFLGHPIPRPKSWGRAGAIMDNSLSLSLSWRTLDAQYWGVPQRRKRVFLVCDFTGRSGPEILFKPDVLHWNPKTGQSKGPESSAGAGRNAHEASSTAIAIENHQTDSRIKMKDDGIVETLTARMGTGGCNIPLVYDYYCMIPGSRALYTKNVATSLTAHDAKQTQIVCCERFVRSLTPLECNRLQGFPEGWTDNLTTDDPEFWRKVYDTWCDINGKKRKTDKQIKKLVDSCGTDSARYRMWGNGVALPCVIYVMERIMQEEMSHDPPE